MTPYRSPEYADAYGDEAARLVAATGVPFAHLHAHTTFSFLDGYGTAKQIAARVAELGHASCAITDHGNVVGHVPVAKAMRALGINPVYGCEFYVCDDMRVKGRHCPSLPYETKGNSPGPLPHITVLAQTQKGYENLLALSSASYAEGFHHKPRIDHRELVARQEGLAVLSGCPGGYPSRMMELGMHAEAWSLMSWLSSSIERYFVEVTPSPGYDVSHRVTDTLFEWAGALGRPVVMTADAHFPRPEDHEAQDLLLAVGLRLSVKDPTRTLRLPAHQFYCGAVDMLARSLAVCKTTPLAAQLAAMRSAAELADSCRVETPRGKMVAFPRVPRGDTPATLLRRVCLDGLGAAMAAGRVPDWPAYWARCERELETLSAKGFADYMLAAIDVVLEVKRRGGLVNLRGSAGGSMVMWAAGCSVTDPILHGLSFERFWDETRPDPPDIDIDFEKASRPGAIEYMAETYGRDRVAQIAGLSQMRGKGALQNLCFGLGVHPAEFRPYADLMDDDATTEAAMAACAPLIAKRPEIGRLLPKVMGQLKTTTVHAAGVLVSSEPLGKCVGIMSGGSGQPVASVDKRGAADLGLLKMDFLNVQALDVVGTAARLVNVACGRDPLDVEWVRRMPLDDPRVLATAAGGRLAGVFQLDGAAAWKASKAIGVDSFDDLVAAIAMCRPGPMESIPMYRRHKDDPAELAAYLAGFTPAAAAIVEGTYGVLVYQEQVMRIAREVAGMEWPHVHKLRKQIADKAGLDPSTGDAWRAEWQERFISGARATVGMGAEEAEHWWHAIETHGGYSFNKSHGVSYGVVAYWMLWLKTHWPAQFYEAFLGLESDNDVLRKRLIFEFKAMGGRVEMLHPSHSRARFRAVGGTLYGGYQDVRGLGPKTAEKIEALAPFGSWESMMEALPKAASSALVASRFWDPERCDPCRVAVLAPWLPVPGMPAADMLELIRRGVAPCGHLTPEPIDSVAVGGYVTAKDFTSDKIMLTVEDPWGSATVRVARKNVQSLGPRFRWMEVGDLVAVDGWWTGDCLFAKDAALVRAAKEKKP